MHFPYTKIPSIQFSTMHISARTTSWYFLGLPMESCGAVWWQRLGVLGCFGPQSSCKCYSNFWDNSKLIFKYFVIKVLNLFSLNSNILHYFMLCLEHFDSLLLRFSNMPIFQHPKYDLRWRNCADLSLGWTGLVILKSGQVIE